MTDDELLEALRAALDRTEAIAAKYRAAIDILGGGAVMPDAGLVVAPSPDVQPTVVLPKTKTTRERNHTCEKCGRKFTGQGIAKHRKSCKGKGDLVASYRNLRGSRLECDDCDDSFAAIPELIRHTIAVHDRQPHATERMPKAG